jgi:hypothetical protein
MLLPPFVVAALAEAQPRLAKPVPVEWETLAMTVRQLPLTANPMFPLVGRTGRTRQAVPSLPAESQEPAESQAEVETPATVEL